MTKGGYQVTMILPIKSEMAAAKKLCLLRFLYLGTVHKHFKGGLLQKCLSQKIAGPSLFAMKITGQPLRKACKLNF